MTIFVTQYTAPHAGEITTEVFDLFEDAYDQLEKFEQEASPIQAQVIRMSTRNFGEEDIIHVLRNMAKIIRTRSYEENDLELVKYIGSEKLHTPYYFVSSTTSDPNHYRVLPFGKLEDAVNQLSRFKGRGNQVMLGYFADDNISSGQLTHLLYDFDNIAANDSFAENGLIVLETGS